VMMGRTDMGENLSAIGLLGRTAPLARQPRVPPPLTSHVPAISLKSLREFLSFPFRPDRMTDFDWECRWIFF
jgi:hypothetical protein